MHNLVEAHLRYAHAIAAETLKKCPSNVDCRDVRSAAELGLVQAARAYDPSVGIAFSTFAYYRIRGAIYDELRQICRASKCEIATSDYIPNYTGAHDGANRVTSHTVTSYLLSMQALSQEPASTSGESPTDRIFRKQQAEQVKTALKNLPEKYRRVLDAYYYADLSFEEIGHQLGLSKSWVCRMHAKGLLMVREALRQRSVRLDQRGTLRSKWSNSSPRRTITRSERDGSSRKQHSIQVRQLQHWPRNTGIEESTLKI